MRATVQALRTKRSAQRDEEGEMDSQGCGRVRGAEWGAGGLGGGAATAVPATIALEEQIEAEVMGKVYEELLLELRQQEDELARQWEAEQRRDRAATEAMVVHEAVSRDGVVCPLCQRAMLMANVGVIFCGGRHAYGCQFRVDTNLTNVTLPQLKGRLEGTVAAHASRCPGAPRFSIEQPPGVPGMSMLLMRCPDCHAVEVIL